MQNEHRLNTLFLPHYHNIFIFNCQEFKIRFFSYATGLNGPIQGHIRTRFHVFPRQTVCHPVVKIAQVIINNQKIKIFMQKQNIKKQIVIKIYLMEECGGYFSHSKTKVFVVILYKKSPHFSTSWHIAQKCSLKAYFPIYHPI